MPASNGATPDIRLVDLSKSFREVRAVDGVSLEIQAGEFFSLLGPSGCGKTTTLRMIGGFEAPTSGRIELRDEDVTALPPDKRPVNMVFQNYALFPHLDVAGNVAFGLKRKHVPAPEIAHRVAAVLDLVEMAGYERRHPSQLSGGQQQRVALARALVNEPNVLLLDEPLGALDLKLRRQLQLELKRIQDEVGITFVYVTHDQEEALTMSDRIAVMNRGRIEQLGTPEELYERPASRFVADFIGTTNLLHGTIEAIDGDAAVVRLGSGEQCLIRAAGAVVGRSAEISVRPEGVALGSPSAADRGDRGDDRGDGAGDIGLEGIVEQVAYLGASVQYHVRTRGGLTVTALTAKSGPRRPVGEHVTVSWPLDEALLLDIEPESSKEERR